MTPDTTARLGGIELDTPLVAASGTVGSAWELARAADVSVYGALVAKSVSLEEWPGRPAPRLAPAGNGMLNGIGIQNPGIDEWVQVHAARTVRVAAPVWGSAVGRTPDEFAAVAAGLQGAGLEAIEVNLSCPNLDDGRMFALDPAMSREVVAAVVAAVSVPVGAKLSPNAEDIVAVAAACGEAGSQWVTLTNTVWGAGIDIGKRRPWLSGLVGGYSGPPLKPIAMRCVLEVAAAVAGLPVIGCGGVVRGADVIEYMLAGASAVGLGTVHLAEPRAGARILGEVVEWCTEQGVARLADLVGEGRP